MRIYRIPFNHGASTNPVIPASLQIAFNLFAIPAISSECNGALVKLVILFQRDRVTCQIACSMCLDGKAT